GINQGDAIGTFVESSIPNTRLIHILKTGEYELNSEQVMQNQQKIITNRVPVRDEKGRIIGAVAVFRDITEMLGLTQQVTDLREIRSMLQAVIQSSEDAISVVDQDGLGIIINPAYTRLTGLSSDEVIGKRADVDIYEGESMHLRVLETQKPVRGVHMKVGLKRKDVIVNVAPILVDGQLKGSVAVIHDITGIRKLTDELERAKQIIRTLEAKYTFEDIIGTSENMKLALEQGRLAASTPATVLLRGESGTGKELFAHAIHNASDRRFNQFIRVNCASISEISLESDLFGYEDGAFTGAKKGGKKGLFEEADGGTVFLDEIGELSVHMQAKLLRVLQEKEIIRVGGSKSITIDVRVITATHANLEKGIQEGTFREDLYYRLNVLPIFIPPLRYRKQDIEEIALHILKKFNREYGRCVESISQEALELLTAYHWPGNIRELENILGRSIIQMKFSDQMIEWNHLLHLKEIMGQSNKSVGFDYGQLQLLEREGIKPLHEVVDLAEKQYIQNVVDKVKGNKTEAAKRLGISIRSLYYKMERYDLLLM
ncbi:MAG: sigma 54-interacting transcriptional regulator, partial [Bacilli bacterium]